MATYAPAKRNTAFVFYVGLVSQADGKILQVNPTLAAGDVKIAKDDGAPANLATLPAVDADFTKRVKVSLSATEMDADQVTILFVDAAGAEWCDLMVNIQTVARQYDDLAYPATSGRSLDVDASGRVLLQATTHTGAVVPTVTTLTGHTAQTGDTFARLGAPAGASVSADIAAIEAQTDDIGVAGAGLTALATQASVDAIDDLLDTEITDIRNRLPAALVAGRMDSSVGANAAGVITSAAFALDAIDAAAIKADAATEIADALLDRASAVEGLTVRQVLRVIASVLAGKASGLPTAPVYRDLADTKDRVTATTDEDGNRTAVTVDAT